ncbi:MAG: hypothetical protein F6K21_01035 [Symploca sp. SIO2D2]|nr:hypothetical protein [Symploca sp. SIO2D2]
MTTVAKGGLCYPSYCLVKVSTFIYNNPILTPHLGNHSLEVATSDRAQQQTVLGYGAEWMSSQQLAKEVETTIRRTRSQQRPQKPARGRFLVNSLDAKSQQRLAQLRRGIK